MINEEGQEYYNETMPMPRQATHRELLEEAMKVLQPFADTSNHQTVWTWPDRAACLRAAFDWPDSEGKRTSLRVGDLRQARTTYNKLKAAFEQDKDEP